MNSAMVHCPHCSFKQAISSKKFPDIFITVCEGCGNIFKFKWQAHGVVVLPENKTCNSGE